ncbi:hypothetical protein MMC29_004644 [Sticta canariensis]|nr:hypothetical protein [Sticta canariensis]
MSLLTVKVDDEGEKKTASLAMGSQTACRKANVAAKATKKAAAPGQGEGHWRSRNGDGRSPVDTERKLAKERYLIQAVGRGGTEAEGRP